MSDLVLNSFTIENFRIFDEITLPNLGRVNLIVGKNGVGKSTLLEALQIYATQNSDFAISNFLQHRKEAVENIRPQAAQGQSQADIRKTQLKSLFHNRSLENDHIVLKSDQLTVNITLDSEGRIKSDKLNGTITVPISVGIAQPINHYFQKSGVFPTPEEVDRLWSSISLTRYEGFVVEALKTLNPSISRVNVLPSPLLNGERIPLVLVDHFEEAVPLASLGDGAVHIFQFMLTLIAARDGILLTDEIETGLHYSVQHRLWSLIFRFAAELNVQVFATTHSSDCISAFQMAAEESPESGVLIRLENWNGKIMPTIADEELLQNAVEQDIEVR